MYTTRTLAVIVGLCAATGAAAQSSSPSSGPFSAPGDFFIDGYVDLSYIDRSGDTTTFLSTRTDLGFAPSGGIGFGFALGIDAAAIDSSPGSSDQWLALYPAVQFGTQIGTFSAGIPRPVLDQGYLPDHVFGRSPLFDIQLSPFIRSFLRTQYIVGDDIPYGLRYDGTFGATSIGASYHRLDSSLGKTDVTGLAFRHELEAISSFYSFAVFGGVEHVERSFANNTNYRIGVEGGTDALNAGLILGDVFDVRTTNLFAEYEINDFTLHGSAVRLKTPGGTRTIYGLGAEYSFANNAYVGLGTIFEGGGGLNDAYELSVGWRF